MVYKLKKVIAFLLIVSLSLAIISGCNKSESTDDKTIKGNIQEENSEAYKENTAEEEFSNNIIGIEYNDEDLENSFNEKNSTIIECRDSEININGNGAKEAEGKINITAAGTYIFRGNLLDGQIIVDAGKEDVVRIVLDGFIINCSDSCPIYGIQSKKIILTLNQGTKNEVSDGSKYVNINEEDNEPNASIFTKDDLVINGEGTLVVKGNYNHGIFSKDDLKIISGNLNINSTNDGLKGKDSVVIRAGNLNINAGGDGIQSNNDTETDKGYIVLEGGVFNITASNDGIQAETILQVTGGKFEILTGGGSENASTDDKGNERQEWGHWNPDTEAQTDTEEEIPSAKGTKAGKAIYIAGSSNFSINSSDDSIHSNGNVNIIGGNINISSGDDGIHGDSALIIDGGVIDIAKSYEGLEGKSITINGGNIHVISRDDGLNAAGGNDGSSLDQRSGRNNFSGDGDVCIKITEGYVYVDSEGDGIDSNQGLYIYGGIVLVNGPANGANSAIDYDGNAEIYGGIVVAAGSSGMVQTFSESSTQNSIMIYYSSVQEKENLVNLKDNEGNIILSFKPSKEYQSIVISSPKMTLGSSYILSTGGIIEGNSTDGYYQEGKLASDTKVLDIQLSRISTSIDDKGNEVSSGMGGERPQRPSGENPSAPKEFNKENLNIDRNSESVS